MSSNQAQPSTKTSDHYIIHFSEEWRDDLTATRLTIPHCAIKKTEFWQVTLYIAAPYQADLWSYKTVTESRFIKQPPSIIHNSHWIPCKTLTKYSNNQWPHLKPVITLSKASVAVMWTNSVHPGILSPELDNKLICLNPTSINKHHASFGTQ